MININLEVEVLINKSSKKVFDKNKGLEKNFIENIRNFYYKNNLNVDIKKLKGYKNLYRNRINDFKIIYKLINGQIIIVEVLYVASRGQVYKTLKKGENK